ncbi:MAG: TonB family protein [Pseudodonghicola sp.]
MKLLINALFFLTFALVLHLALAALRLEQAGAAAAGDGGAAVLSVEASPASIAALVETWDAVPEVTDTALTAPATPEMTPPAPPRPADLPRPETAALMPAAMPPAMPQAPTMPDRQFDAPPPPEQPRPEPKPEPKPAPQPEAKPEPRSEPRPAPRPEPRPDSRPERKAEPKPAKPPAPAQSSLGARAERAAGSGGSPQAGEAGSARHASAATARQQSQQVQWGAAIRARIERRKRAPRGGGSGTVMLSVSVAPSGQLLAVSIQKSSGNALLDRAALAAVQAAGRFAAAPQGLSQQRYTFTLPIRFTG